MLLTNWRCKWKRSTGTHNWVNNGDTLGGIFIRCICCGYIDEFLPGVYEPRGGEEVWDQLLRDIDEEFGRL